MNEFILYPAIDIRGGKCVRLLQGDYDRETVYGDSPLAMAKKWEEKGASWIHLVDLDGAKAGHPVNDDTIIDIARQVKVPVQVGGGIRHMDNVRTYLEAGISRVILGTSAIQDRPFVEAALSRYGGQKVAIGIDARDGYAATQGWLETSEVKAVELASALVAKGAQTFIYTDISRDGMLNGPNLNAVKELAAAINQTVIASGGVSQLEDLFTLAQCKEQGVGGAIVGKALYTQRIDLTEAVDRLKGE